MVISTKEKNKLTTMKREGLEEQALLKFLHHGQKMPHLLSKAERVF